MKKSARAKALSVSADIVVRLTPLELENVCDMLHDGLRCEINARLLPADDDPRDYRAIIEAWEKDRPTYLKTRGQCPEDDEMNFESLRAQLDADVALLEKLLPLMPRKEVRHAS